MKRFIILFVVLTFSVLGFGQLFNVSPKAHIGGMPGNQYNDVWGYVGADNQEYAIIGSSQAINIFDVTDCANPILKMQHVDGSTVTWRDFKTYQGYAYAVCDGSPCTEGLQIIKLSDYTVTQQTDMFTAAHNIWVDEVQGRLYVAGSNSSGGFNLLIYTLDTEIVNGVTYAGTPANPVFLKKHFTSYIHDMYAHNHMVFASHGYNGYKLWNCSNPLSPVELANNPDNIGYNHSSYVTADGYAYGCEEVPRGRPIKIYQVTGSGLSTAINLITTFSDPCEAPTYTNSRPHNPFVKGDTLFVSYYEDGVQMWDISNRTNPKRIAYYDTYRPQNGLGYDQSAHDWKGVWGVYPYLPSGCNLISDLTQGLFTFKTDIPPVTTTTIDKMDKITGDLVINNKDKGLILRNSEGYCYRVKVNDAGTLSTEQVICDIASQKYVKTYKTDIGISSGRGLVLKSTSACYRLVMSGSTLTTQSISSCNITSNSVRTDDSDVIIETGLKGLILSNGSQCFRVNINETGALTTTLLSECE